MKNVIIEKYSQDNFSKVVDLLSGLQNYFIEIDSFQERIPFPSKFEAKQLLKQILKDVKNMNGSFFIAKINDEVVGFVQGIINDHKGETMHNLTYKPSKDGWIGFLFVTPEFRGQQIGKLLINSMKDFFKENGCDTMRLIVSSDNTNAISVYKKYGFRTTDLKMSVDL